jgi:RNA recognition motif-containing protein
MATKLYVGNLADETTEQDLDQLFRAYGKVSNVEVISALGGGGSGFGFVEMLSADAARKAVQELKGRPLHNHFLVVNETSVMEEEVV